MRCAERLAAALVCLLALAAPCAAGEGLLRIHRVHYSMGTVWDVIVFHASLQEGERAIAGAMAEIARLDGVMSTFLADSDLSKLNRKGGDGFVAVDASLFDAIREALAYSRLSGGTFDVTIAPLLDLWKTARDQGRTPSDEELAAARACVGSEHVELLAPDRVRYRRPCVRVDLGGIGKGYAVDRAIAALAAAGVRHALVNAGGSSIAAIGAPPGRAGWPVRLGPDATGARSLELRSQSVSTSQQHFSRPAFTPGAFGDIIDPRTRGPADAASAVSVVAPTATASDALSTALVMLSREDARAVLARVPDAFAVWIPE